MFFCVVAWFCPCEVEVFAVVVVAVCEFSFESVASGFLVSLDVLCDC